MTTFRNTSKGDADYRRSILGLNVADEQALAITGLELTHAQPLHVAMVDGSGDQIISFGGGTQYAELTTTDPGTGTLALGRYNATPPSLTDKQMIGLQVDSSGALMVAGAGGGHQYNAGDSGVGAFGNAIMYLDVGNNFVFPSVSAPLPEGLIQVAASNGYAPVSETSGLVVDLGLNNDVTISSDVTVVQPTASDLKMTVGNAAGAAAVNIQDGGNTITVDGTVSVGNAGGGAAVNIQDGGNTITVDGTVATTSAMPTTLIAFVTDIPTATTRVQLASNVVTNGIVIEAASTNTGNIYIGGSLVSSTVYGAILAPGQSVGLAIDNTNRVYVDTATNGNDVAVFGS